MMGWLKLSDDDGGTFAQEVDNPVAGWTINELDTLIAQYDTDLAELIDTPMQGVADIDDAIKLLNNHKAVMRAKLVPLREHYVTLKTQLLAL